MFQAHHGIPIPVVFVVGLGVGLACGSVTGIITAVGRVPSLVVTLAMLYIIRGVDTIIVGSGQVVANALPNSFINIFHATVFGIPDVAIAVAVIVAIAAYYLRTYRSGRELYAMGSDPDAARLGGIPIGRRIFGAFLLSGALAGLGGVLWATQYNTIDATAATGLELQVIAAVVVGGVAIFGGSGSVVGAALGALLLQTINSALNVLGVPSLWTQAISGFLLLVAITLDRGIQLRLAAALRRRGFTLAPESRAFRQRLAPLLRWETGLVVALVAVVIFGNSVSSQFFSSYNIFTLGTNIGDLAILALPMTLIIITGEIDLSIASVLAVSAETLGALWTHHWPMGLIFVVCIAIGAIAGLINGLLITRVGLPSLAVTIGTLTLYRGLANVILGASTVSNFPAPFNTLGVNGFLGISWLSWSVAIFLVLAVITGVILRMTPFGRSLYAIGLSQEAAFHAGIRVKRTKLLLFVLSGVVAAAVGLLYAFELSSAGENIAIGFELQVVTIVLLGGVSIFGGKGTILGVALAAFVYAGLRSALLLTPSFNENDFEVVSGGLLILSVLVPNAASFVQRARVLMRRGQIRDRRKLLALADAEVLDRE